MALGKSLATVGEFAPHPGSPTGAIGGTGPEIDFGAGSVAQSIPRLSTVQSTDHELVIPRREGRARHGLPGAETSLTDLEIRPLAP